MEFDVAVIGGGIGGYSAAVRASELNLKTVLIEENKLGGTCLNVGCIPTKILVKKAAFFKKAKKFGFQGHLDLSQIINDKNQKVQKMAQGLSFLLKSHKVNVIQGKAVFAGKNELEVNGQTIKAKNIIIATGSSPLDLEQIKTDQKTVFNSNSILNLTNQPKSLAIIGGGYIGCEFAFFFNAIGTKVFLIEACDRLLSFADENIVSSYQKILQKQGIEILLSSPVQKIQNSEGQALIELKDKTIEAEKVLLAVGRKIETGNLNLAKIGLTASQHGCIEVNEYMQTKLAHIYAVGDVTGKIQLAHLALQQGITAAENIAGNKQKQSYSAVPAILFTSPELACCGMSLKEALAQNIKAKEATFPLTALGIAIALEETEGVVKIVFEETTKKILGAQLLGENVSYLISEMALAINSELTLDQLAKTIHPHPTLSEALFEAALMGRKTPLHIANHPSLKREV